MIVCFVIGKFSIQLWYIFVDIGQIFSVVNGQILKTYFRHLVTLVFINNYKVISSSQKKIVAGHFTALKNLTIVYTSHPLYKSISKVGPWW